MPSRPFWAAIDHSIVSKLPLSMAPVSRGSKKSPSAVRSMKSRFLSEIPTLLAVEVARIGVSAALEEPGVRSVGLLAACR